MTMHVHGAVSCISCRYETIKAADAVAALKASLKPVATARRDGKWQNLDAKELVPGDMVLLGAGSAIPAGMATAVGGARVLCVLRGGAAAWW